MAPPKTKDGRPRVVLEKPDSQKLNFFTHDWSDKTTWYSSSIRVVDETAANDDAGVFLSYALAHTNVINTSHGLVYQEDYLQDPDGFDYLVHVKVDGVTVTPRDPHHGADGDYQADYINGKIVFFSALTSESVVTVTYHYATDSVFVVAPVAGKQIYLDFVECQFSEDIVMNDTVVFQPYGFVEVFAPQYCTSNGGPYPPGTKIPLGNPMKYKSFTDFQAEATKSYVQYPVMGGDNWRAATQKLTVINWDYLAATELKSSFGLEIRIFLEHDVPFGGWYATATFYCRIEDEP